MAAYRLNIPPSGGTYTAATLNTGCQLDSQIQMTPDTGFSAIVTQGHYTFDGASIILTASTNGASSQREGYMEVVYQIGGSECKKYIHLVQEAPPAPKATLKLSNGTTVTVMCNGDSELTRNEMTNLVTASDVVSVHVEDCVTKIGEIAFLGFNSLTSITMADSVTEIGDRVKSEAGAAHSLKSIQFSNNLAKIGEAAFAYCEKITSLSFPNSLVTLDKDCFTRCSGLTSVNIPDSVQVIGADAFSYNRVMTGVTIGTGWTRTNGIGRSFEYNSALKKVVVKATRPADIGDDFYFCDGTYINCWHDGFKIYVPRNSVDAYKRATNWSSYAEVIEPIS